MFFYSIGNYIFLCFDGFDHLNLIQLGKNCDKKLNKSDDIGTLGYNFQKYYNCWKIKNNMQKKVLKCLNYKYFMVQL